jgi:hypothetical protein
MRDGELAGKPYARFWRPEMAPLPPHAREALACGPVAAPLLPALADAPAMLAPGEQPLENGFGFARDGSLCVAIRTDLPDVSPEMVDWWFGWHGSEAQRYKLWHPRAHVHAAWGTPDPGGTGRGGYVGRTSFVDEYVGSQLSHVTIRFLPPAELGFDDAEATVVCARIGFAGSPLEPGTLVHHVRRVPGGSEMRSRFWLGGRNAALVGFGPAGGLAVRLVTRFVRPTADNGRDLLVHCAQEMAHLGSFLPALHAELHDSP